MDASTRLKRGAKATFQVVAEEAILIHLDTGTYFSLNKVGTEFWNQLDGQISIAQAADAIVDKYNDILSHIVADVRALADRRPTAEDIHAFALSIPTQYQADAPAIVNDLNALASTSTDLDTGLRALAEKFAGQYRVTPTMFISDLVELGGQLLTENLVDVA